MDNAEMFRIDSNLFNNKVRSMFVCQERQERVNFNLIFCFFFYLHNSKTFESSPLPSLGLGLILDRLFLVFLGVIFQHSTATTEPPFLHPSLTALRQIYELEIEKRRGKSNIIVQASHQETDGLVANLANFSVGDRFGDFLIWRLVLG